jgi:hypothetical protein
MSHYKIKGSFETNNTVVTKFLEYKRGYVPSATEVKSGFESLFGHGNLSLRFRSADGKVQPIYQDFHIKDALKDAETSKSKSITVLLHKEGGSSSNIQSSAKPTSTTNTPSNTASPAKTSSPTTGGRPKFCEGCGAGLPATGKFCPECGFTLPSGNAPASPATHNAPASTAPQNSPRGTSSSAEPKCGGCGNALSGSAVKALDRTWHRECFSCTKCKKSLLQGGFVEDDNKNPLCGDCFDEQFSKSCAQCGQKINGTFVNVEGRDYHKGCFVCHKCGSEFTGGYYMQDNHAMCKNCIH